MNGISVFFSLSLHPQPCSPLNLRNHKTKQKQTNEQVDNWRPSFEPYFLHPLTFSVCSSFAVTQPRARLRFCKHERKSLRLQGAPCQAHQGSFFSHLLYHNVLMVCFVSCEASNIFSLPFCCVLYSVCFCCEWMQILEGLVKLPDNRECADCRTKYFPFSQPIVLC